MKLTRMDILLISPEPWDHIFVSKHHYAVNLARRGNRVYFLNPPQARNFVVATAYENVFSVSYSGFPRGLRFYPQFLVRRAIRRRFEQLESVCGAHFDVVWSFDNSVFFDFSALPENVLTISHIVDFSQYFQFTVATRTADVCLGVSRSIVENQKVLNPRSHFVNHGYSVVHSTDRVSLPRSEFEYRVGYAGNLDLKYIDWNCIREIITAHPNAAFYLAGPYSGLTPNIKWLKEQSNVFLLGRHPSESLSSFYDQLDLLIICYRADDYIQQLENTHKMMEYLGSGKMIVSTFVAEYAELSKKNVLLMSNSNAEFPALFEDALRDIRSWNDDKKSQLRKRTALDNTYDNQLERIENLINRR